MKPNVALDDVVSKFCNTKKKIKIVKLHHNRLNQIRSTKQVPTDRDEKNRWLNRLELVASFVSGLYWPPRVLAWIWIRVVFFFARHWQYVVNACRERLVTIDAECTIVTEERFDVPVKFRIGNFVRAYVLWILLGSKRRLTIFEMLSKRCSRSQRGCVDSSP